MNAEAKSRYAFALKWVVLVVATLLVAALPAFERSYEVMRVWSDQSLYMSIMDLVSEGRSAEALDLNYMGPLYVALSAAVRGIFHLDSAGALIFLNRLSVIGGFALLVAVAIIRPASLGMRVFALIVLATYALSTPFFYASSIPWSHFILGFFGIAFLLVLSLEASRMQALLVGLALGVLSTTRLFEALAAGLLLLAFVGFQLAYRRSVIDWKQTAEFGGLWVVGFILAYASHAIVLGDFHIFTQYQNMLGEGHSGPTFNFLDLPVKLGQFFLDPCFFSYCQSVDYTKPTALVIGEDTALQNWRMPFILQIPFYAAGLLIGAVLVLFRPSLVLKLLADRVAFVGLGIAVLVPLIYAAYLVGGASQLKFGFMRDLYFPTVALLFVFLHIVISGLLSRRERQFCVLAFPIVAVLGLQLLPYWFGTPRLTSTHIARMTAEEICEGELCSLHITYLNPSDDVIEIPFDRLTRVRIECDGGDLAFNDIVPTRGWTYTPRELCPANYRLSAMSTTTGVSRYTRDLGIGATIETTLTSDMLDQTAEAQRAAMAATRCPATQGALRPELEERVRIAFSQPENVCGSGWSHVETWGRWTEEANATLFFNLPDADHSRVLEMNVSAYTAGQPSRQRVEVTVNDEFREEWLFDAETDRVSKSIQVPDGATELEIRFALPDARSPLSASASPDPRTLGISVTTACLTASGIQCP